MSDKMPINIWAYETNCKNSKGFGHWYDEDVSGQGAENKCDEYTLVRNNPDYHVIKKSDVDGDVIKKLKSIQENIISLFSTGQGIEMTEFCIPLEIDNVINALIAQSDSDMVRIPRKVLEAMIDHENPYDEHKEFLHWVAYEQYLDGKNQAINKVLNYKPTEVGEERSDGDGE